jgi:type IV fimbrial biogenesis protein FimT
MMRTPSKRSRGFTLIELMTVVAVVAIFAALAAPAFSQMIAAQRARSATSAVVESLWLARSEAIKRNADVGFAFSSIGNGWQVTAGGTTLHVQDSLPAVSSTAASFQFNPSGRLTGTGIGDLQIEVPSASVFRCVTVSSTGRSNVKDQKCG